MRRIGLVVFLSFAMCWGCAMKQKPKQSDKLKSGTLKVEKVLQAFINQHVSEMARLEKENNLAYWKATTTGDQDAYQRVAKLEFEIRKIHSDKKAFMYLKKTRESAKVKDPLLKRQLEILYLSFQENQVNPELLKEITDLSTELQKIFNGYRATVDGKQLTDNDIYDILASSTDTKRRKAAWEGYKARGKLIKNKLLKLVKLRNRIASQLGYKDFYHMSLKLLEQDPKEIEQVFDQLALGTDKPFADLVHKVNSKLAERYGIPPEALRPWHYEDPFFQEAPSIGRVKIDRFFREIKMEHLVERFYRGIGFEVKDIISKSDLYEKKGKMPHAFCTDIDRAGDVRILANLRPSEKWASTLLHEMGHAIYDKYIDQKLPWLLRAPSHPFTTEAVAEFFGRLTKQSSWLTSMLELKENQLSPIANQLKYKLKLSMLIFTRWAMVVRHFEKELYRDPDQDLNKLWWDLKQRYQLINPPEGRDAPDWASKIHIASWPVYYHNYVLGELMASQLVNHVAKKVFKGEQVSNLQLVGRKEIGTYLKEKIFSPGRSLRWNELLIQATGESLNPKYFIEQFAN